MDQMGRLPLTLKAGFGVGDLGFNLFWASMEIFLLFYYVEVLGLPNGVAGLIIGGAMFWDAVTDPVMGFLAERTRTRWGRYRPYLLFGGLPLGISFALMLWKPNAEGAALVAYAFATHILFRTTYTALSIPYSSLMARLTTDTEQRNQLAAFRMIGAMIGAVSVALSMLPLATALGGGDMAQGFFWVALIYAGLAWALMLTTFALTREPPDDGPRQVSPPLRDIVRMLMRNRPFLLVLAGILLIHVAGTISSKCLVFFAQYNLGDRDLIGIILLTSIAVTFVCTPIWSRITARTNKRLVWLAGTAISTVFGIAIFLTDISGVTVFLVLIGLGAIGRAAVLLTFWSMIGDTVEYGEWKSGIRSESMVFGFVSLAQKAAIGVASIAIGFTFDLIGFQADAVQSASTLLGLKAMITLVPVSLGLAAAAFIFFYPLDQRTHARLVKAIAWHQGHKATALKG